MSFSKLSYDNCAYEKSLTESMNVGHYMLNTPYNDCKNKNCYNENPSVINNNTGVAVSKHYPLIDVNSELLGLNMKHSECPSKRKIDNSYAINNPLNTCSSFVNAEDTLLSNPPCTLRGTGWNRFDFLHENPQDKALMPFERNIQNRLIVKDNHKPCLPNPINNDINPKSDNLCYTDVHNMKTPKYSEKKEMPFIHWRSCEEIDDL